MSIDLGEAFGAYSREELQETLTRQVDLELADFAKFGVVPKDQT